MTKLQKLIVLIVLSLSVYIVYQKTNNSKYKILNINDNTNKKNSYIYYYEKELLKTKKEVIIDNNYSKKNQTINNLLFTIKNTSEIKAQLINTDQLIISLGYNDLLFNIAISEKDLNKIINDIEKDFNRTIREIRKYYHKPIIVIGYPSTKTNNNFLNQGLKKLNKRLRKNQNIEYIDIYNYYNRNKKVPKDKYQYIISHKIISKTLEIS